MHDNLYRCFSRWLFVIIPLSVTLVCIESSAQAQQRSRFALEYPMTVPYGETKDFISDTSYSGFGFSFFSAVDPHVSWGMSFQWINFEKTKDFATYEKNGATVAGNEQRSIDAFPVMVVGRFGFNLLPNIYTFAGIGAGMAYVEQAARLGFFYDDEYSTQGIYAPEVGLYLSLGSTDLGAGVQYIDSFTTGTDTADLNGMTIRLSIGFTQ